VHLFDCDEDLYGQRLNIRFYKKIREEQKFSGLDTLLEQIKIDVEQAKNYFSKG
jgi:riboflavin kinase/FMN adenylyltransferase